MTATIDVSPGELIDKITILEIKAERVATDAKLVHVRRELAVLCAARDRSVKPSAALAQTTLLLRDVNNQLWDIEDAIRACERAQDFGPRFIELARAVYQTNDRRAALKNEINSLLHSDLVEVKSYQAY